MNKLLAIYSFLPGAAKIFGSSVFFALNLPILFFLYFKTNVVTVKKSKFIVILVFLLLVLGHFLVTYISNHKFNLNSFFSSLYIWIIPMIGIYLVDGYNKTECYKAIVAAALMHSCVGFLIYGFFPLPNFLEVYADKLLEGAAYFRMSSVAGSLIFSSIVSCGFNCHLLLMYHRSRLGKVSLFDWFILVFLLLSVLLSLQRSSWLAIIPALVLFLFSNRRLFIITLCISVPMIFVIVGFVLDNTFYYERVMSLFSSNYSAIDERFEIWIHGLNQFNDNVFGLGIGQSGQFAYKEGVLIEHYITDGDYVKILSEGGIFLTLIYLTIIFSVLVTYISRVTKDPVSSSFSFFVVLGFFIQMIGSNISEYYFVNFLFWVSLGLFFDKREVAI